MYRTSRARVPPARGSGTESSSHVGPSRSTRGRRAVSRHTVVSKVVSPIEPDASRLLLRPTCSSVRHLICMITATPNKRVRCDPRRRRPRGPQAVRRNLQTKVDPSKESKSGPSYFLGPSTGPRAFVSFVYSDRYCMAFYSFYGFVHRYSIPTQ